MAEVRIYRENRYDTNVRTVEVTQISAKNEASTLIVVSW